ncbi:MAG: exosortase system-associated protein, TIGR04073 family [Candidatus Omnitrophica bacterium]|nr:exosortase system-associated protein, TIGR04073 family [Candidatus Omnitrophota bacterium]
MRIPLRLMRAVRRGALILSVFSLPGCWLFPLSRDVARARSQIASLEQRIDQLETVAIASPAVDAGLASGTVSRAAIAGSVTALDTVVPAAGTVPAEIGGTSAAQSGLQLPGLPFDTRGALTKLVRGLTNILTGWVEIPKRVQETTETSGAASGFTFGLLRGLGYGFIRTAGGAYETVTFPFPAPPGYQPVMQPPYVFVCLCDEPGNP